MTSAVMAWLIPVAVTALVTAFIRFYPKQKLMDVVGPFTFRIGSLVSKFGNSKIGKSAMDKIEEGVLATLISVAMHGLVEFGRGLNSDNEKR